MSDPYNNDFCRTDTFHMPNQSKILRAALPESMSFAEAALSGRTDQAQRLMNSAMQSGLTFSEASVRLIQPAMYHIGRLWQDHRITVTQEQLATAVSHSVLAGAFTLANFAPRTGKKVIFAAVAGNYHSLGMRMVCDSFETGGWDAIYLGTNIEAADLIRQIEENTPDLLALSLSLPRHLASARELLERARAELGNRCPPTMIGGQATQLDDSWRTLKCRPLGGGRAARREAGGRMNSRIGSTESGGARWLDNFGDCLSVIVAIVGEDGTLVASNAGFRRLLDVRGDHATRNVAGVFAAPTFEQLTTTHAEPGQPIYSGVLNLDFGTPEALPLIGKIRREGTNLVLLAEFDVASMTNLNSLVLQINEELAEVQRELVHKERSLQESIKIAEMANRAKTEFLSRMSHELRTPLNAILGFAEIMAYDATLPGIHKENVQEISAAGRHLLSLIGELLDLSRIESGLMNIELAPTKLLELIEDCRRAIKPLAAARSITVQVDVPVETQILADRKRLKQVLLNLLSNAVKYNREGGDIRVSAALVSPERMRISVTDTGFGIPAERIPEAFQPFNRLGAEHSTIEGTGIGLAITQQLVKLMGGEVGVDSKVCAGTTFWVELPVAVNAMANPV